MSETCLRVIAATFIVCLLCYAQAFAQDAKGLTVSVKDFGAKGDGLSDDRPAIQAAIDAISSGTVQLPAPAVAYLVRPPSDKKAFLILKSNVSLVGIGNPTIRIAPGSAPYDSVILAPACDQCVVSHLTIDSNVAANPISDTTEIFAHPRTEVFFRSGQGIRVDGVTVTNSASVNSIVSGVGVSGIFVGNCFFLNNGDDPNHVIHDHSALYIHSNGAVITNNLFVAARRGAPSAVTAIETHGSGFSVTGNVIRDYATGMNITGVATSDSTANTVTGNSIEGALNGIFIWSQTYTGHDRGFGINGLTVSGNSIILNQLSYEQPKGGPGASTNGIVIYPTANLPIANVSITSNVIVFDLEHNVHEGNSASIGIGWLSVKAQTAENLLIAQNLIDNPPVAGIRLSASLRACKISSNLIRNAGSSLDSSISDGYKTPILIVGAPAMAVDVDGNQIIDSLSSSRLKVGIRLLTTTGRSSGIRLRDNSITLFDATHSSFASYLQLGDDLTQPYVTASWENFTPPSQRMAAGSEIIDPLTATRWRAGATGVMTKQ